MDNKNNLPGVNGEIFTLTLDRDWNADSDIFKVEYRIVGEIRETEDGFEYDLERVSNVKAIRETK